MPENPLIGFQVDPADIQYIGQDLQRPECILADGFKFTNQLLNHLTSP